MTCEANLDAVHGMTDSELVQLYVRRFGCLPLRGSDLNDLFAVAWVPNPNGPGGHAVRADGGPDQLP